VACGQSDDSERTGIRVSYPNAQLKEVTQPTPQATAESGNKAIASSAQLTRWLTLTPVIQLQALPERCICSANFMKVKPENT